MHDSRDFRSSAATSAFNSVGADDAIDIFTQPRPLADSRERGQNSSASTTTADAMPASDLIGQHVAEASEQHGNLTLIFKEGSYLNVFNPRSTFGRLLSDFVGRRVAKIVEMPDTISFYFDGDLTISVDLRDEAWDGPEALTLNLSSGACIVWN